MISTVTKHFLNPVLWVLLSIVLVGLLLGFIAGASPTLLVASALAPFIVAYFFADFERAVIGLLIVRSALDAFSEQQIPAVYAVGLNALTLLYIIVQLLKGRSVKTDWFWWFFAGWVLLQSMWLALSALGGLGFDYLPLQPGIREWVRLFSWLMAYLLTLQLKGRVPPSKFIDSLFLCLAIPLIAAFIQMILPVSALPSFLKVYGGGVVQGATRIQGTLGHSSIFGQFLFLFTCLTYWKINYVKNKFPWLVLMGILVFIMTMTKSLTSLIMMTAFLLTQSHRMTKNLYVVFGGILIVILIVTFLGYTEYGQARFSDLLNTPILNPDVNTSRAILMQGTESSNSFGWRLQHWHYLLKGWRFSPLLGHGLGTVKLIGKEANGAHNDYIKFLVETGIVGLVAFIAFLGAQFSRLLQIFGTSESSPRRSLSLILFCFLIAWVIGMSTDNVMNNTSAGYIWFSLLAVSGWDWEQKVSNEKKQKNSS